MQLLHITLSEFVAVLHLPDHVPTLSMPVIDTEKRARLRAHKRMHHARPVLVYLGDILLNQVQYCNIASIAKIYKYLGPGKNPKSIPITPDTFLVFYQYLAVFWQ